MKASEPSSRMENTPPEKEGEKRMHYINDKAGNRHTIEEYGWENGKVTLLIDNYKFVNLKMYFRHERTLDDHMGNTPSGYYAIVPINKTERRRVYLHLYR